MPFDPNGMVMDYTRSAYKRQMRFVKGDPFQFFTAQWYFAAATAIPFPGVHRFGSANWDSERHQFSDLGDDALVNQNWANGRQLNRSDGTTYAGPLIYFQEGADAPGPIPRAFGGTPIECLQPPFGLAKGGLDLPVVPLLAGVRKGGNDIPVSVDIAGIIKSGVSQ